MPKDDRVTPNRRAPDLAGLASTANNEHHAYETLQRGALAHAVAAGKALIEAKAALGHGGWLPWLAANVEFPARTAQSYMQIARNPLRVAHLPTVRAALAELAEPKTPVLEAEVEVQSAKRQKLLRDAQRLANLPLGRLTLSHRAVDELYAARLKEEPDWARSLAIRVVTEYDPQHLRQLADVLEERLKQEGDSHSDSPVSDTFIVAPRHAR